MNPPLSFIKYVIMSIAPLDIGLGWFYVNVGFDATKGENQGVFKSANRTVAEIWCHENAKGKWIVDENGILFQSEDDAVLFKLATPQS